VPIYTYPELNGMKRIEDVLGSGGKAVILFLTTGISFGHWIAVFKRGEQLHFFDSYGLRPDGQRRWLSHDKLVELREDVPVVSNLFRDAHNRGFDCWYSETSFQNPRDDSETCGRHVAVRLAHTHPDEQQYINFIRREQAATQSTSDEVVVNLTLPILGK